MMVLTTEQEAAVLRLLSLSLPGWAALGLARAETTELRDLAEHLAQRAVTRREINDSITRNRPHG